MKRSISRLAVLAILVGLLLVQLGFGQVFDDVGAPTESGDSIIANIHDLTAWDTSTIQVHEQINVVWSASDPLGDPASVRLEVENASLGIGCLVFSMDTLDGDQSMLMELIVDSFGVQRFNMVPMNWKRAIEWENAMMGLVFDRSRRTSRHWTATEVYRPGKWGDFWSGYWYYLTHPSEVGEKLETGFYVSGGDGPLIATSVERGTTFTMPTVTVETLAISDSLSGNTFEPEFQGLAEPPFNACTLATVTGTTIVAGDSMVGDTTVLMPVSSNKLHHVFDNRGHNLDDFLSGFGGNQLQAYQAVESAMQATVNSADQSSGLIDDVIINVQGTDITVRGAVIDGVVRIGTFFIP